MASVKVTLHFEAGPEKGRSFTLSSAKTTIGREGADLVVVDGEISRLHAEITVEDDKVQIRDLKSRNGVVLNGKKVRKAVLKNTHQLTLGVSRIRVMIEKSKSLGDVVKQDLKDFSVFESSIAHLAREELKLPWRTRIFLEVMEGPDAGLRVQFSKGTMVIGRPKGDVALSDPDVSAQHALVEAYTSDKVFLSDLDSTNGTWVNGEKVVSTGIRNGDRIRLGRNTVLVFRLEKLK